MKNLKIDFPNSNKGKPICAEDAFMSIADDWERMVDGIASNENLNFATDKLSYSCLLLAVEWGQQFTKNAFKEIERLIKIIKARDKDGWYDILPWQLCLAARGNRPDRTNAVGDLTANLNHRNSSLRILMLRLGWICAPWLIHPHARYSLLINLADSHVYSEMAYVLAKRISTDEEEFLGLCESFDAFFIYNYQSVDPEKRKLRYFNMLERIGEKEVYIEQRVTFGNSNQNVGKSFAIKHWVSRNAVFSSYYVVTCHRFLWDTN